MEVLGQVSYLNLVRLTVKVVALLYNNNKDNNNRALEKYNNNVKKN